MTLLEWQDTFGTEAACEEHLFQQRWPNGFVCPKCQGEILDRSAIRADRSSL